MPEWVLVEGPVPWSGRRARHGRFAPDGPTLPALPGSTTRADASRASARGVPDPARAGLGVCLLSRTAHPYPQETGTPRWTPRGGFDGGRRKALRRATRAPGAYPDLEAQADAYLPHAPTRIFRHGDDRGPRGCAWPTPRTEGTTSEPQDVAVQNGGKNPAPARDPAHAHTRPAHEGRRRRRSRSGGGAAEGRAGGRYDGDGGPVRFLLPCAAVGLVLSLAVR